MASRPRAQKRAGWAVTSIQTVTTSSTTAQNPRKPMMMSKSSPERTFRRVAGTWPWFCSSVITPQSLDRAGGEAGDDLALEHQHQDDQGNGHDGSRSHDCGVRNLVGLRTGEAGNGHCD